MDETGHMNENAGKYNGYDRFDARDALVEELKSTDLLIEIEEITHSVGHSERTGVMVEPYLSEQWFVKMKPLIDDVLKMQSNKYEKFNFFPSRYNKILNQKAMECYDWCISRQLWWGIRMPIWYKDDLVKASVTFPGESWVQEESIMISSYPNVNKDFNFNETIKLMEEIRNFITKARISKKENNIQRREKLLSNPGYVNNAPKTLVEEEKIKLENEKKELEIIIGKLK